MKLVIGGRYNWKSQPERLVYIGMCEPHNGRWHQFAKIETPNKVWCEVLDRDLDMLEPSQPTHAEKLRTLEGQDTGWGYYFEPPPVPTGAWNHDDWVRYIGNRWYWKVTGTSQGTL